LGPALLELFQVYLRVIAEAGWGTDGAHVYITWLRRLLKLLYITNKEMRTPVVHTLVALFERSVHVVTNSDSNGSNSGGGGGGNRGDQNTNNIHYAYGGNETSGGKEKIRAQQLLSNVVASLGADVLLDIAQECPLELRTNGHLLEESYLHMRPNMRSTRAVASMHKVARTLALMSGAGSGSGGDGGGGNRRSGGGVNNSLMIATQKLIFSATTGRQDIRSMFNNNNGTTTTSSSSTGNGFGDVVLVGDGGGGSSNYCLGVILATHLVGTLCREDVTTMSNWILRSMERVPRREMVYAFDFFDYNCNKTSPQFARNVLYNSIDPLRNDLRLYGEALPLESDQQPRWCRVQMKQQVEKDEEGKGEEGCTRRNGEDDANVLHLATCRVMGDVGTGEDAQRIVTLMASCMWSTRTSLLLSTTTTHLQLQEEEGEGEDRFRHVTSRRRNGRSSNSTEESSSTTKPTLAYAYQMPRWPPSLTTTATTATTATTTSSAPWWASLTTNDWTRFTTSDDTDWMAGKYTGEDEERKTNTSLLQKRIRY